MVAAATIEQAKVPERATPEKCSGPQGRHTGLQGEKGKMRCLHRNPKAQRRGDKKFFELKIAEGYRNGGGGRCGSWPFTSESFY